MDNVTNDVSLESNCSFLAYLCDCISFKITFLFMSVCAQAMANMWKTENNLWGFSPSLLYHVDSRN